MPKSEGAPNIAMDDKLLLSLDEGAFGALYRVLIGFAAIPARLTCYNLDRQGWQITAEYGPRT